MGLRIQTNMQAMSAQRNLVTSTESNNQSMERLASGYRINKAADDAAGLAISEKLKADIRGLNMARRNASDGVSLVQTAEGGLNEVGNILSRLRELAVQSSSDTIGNTERGFLNKEYTALKDEIDRITNATEYNGTRLLVGNQESLDSSLVNRSNPYPLEIQVGKDYFTTVDDKGQSNPVNVIRIDLQNLNTNTDSNGLNLGRSTEDGGTRVDSKEGAQQSIGTLDAAIQKVADYRSYLGAIQSRLGSTINNLSVQTENFAAANSRIRDTDFADESARLTQSNILKQAGVAVLSQANQSPQAALRLLG
ncbi:MAG: flagellin FliC [Betaproteobacteria bacterium]|nr:flagellin FliC [Betaproteobacteria bacterium]